MSSLGQRFVAELVGTFIFLGVIIHVVNKSEENAWIKVGLALSIAILLVGNVSGGHFNPAVSFMFLITNKINIAQFIVEFIAQIIGALCAIGLYYTIIT
jgi:glycerol uptake facilitator-like aquaporin